MNRLWRIAGALCIGHVVLLLAGYSQQRSPVFGDPAASIVRTYAGVATTKMYVGGFIATLAWLTLLTAVTLVARLLRGTGETTGWYSNLILTSGATATAITLGVAFATSGAAFYGAKHGFAPDVVASIAYVAKFADFIAMAALGLCAIAVGGAALSGRLLPRWFGWLSILVGVLGIAGASGTSVLNFSTLVWLAWFVALAVVLMRAPGRTAAPAVTGTRALTEVA